MQDWELRYYSYNCRWSPPNEMASMRNGSGDHYFILFTPEGSVMKGFCRAATTSRNEDDTQKYYTGLPAAFETSFLHEPAFLNSEVSFVFWRLHGDARWSKRPVGLSEIETGENVLVRILSGGPEEYSHWATDYYEHEIPLSVIRDVYNNVPINQSILSELNPGANIAKLTSDLDEIGYPSQL
jgi:hypothetical protein